VRIVTRLYRSRRDRMLAGVSGGLADLIGIDPTLIRIGWVILAFASGGIVVLVYIVLALVVPEEPVGGMGPVPPFGATGDPGSSTNWGAVPGGFDPAAGPSAAPPAPTPRRRDERTTALVLGVILVVAGLLLLARQLMPAFDADIVWPFALVALGGVILLTAFRRR